MTGERIAGAPAPGEPARRPMISASAAARLLADGHVHFYGCYDRELFLGAALANFRRGAGELGLPPGTPGCLLLGESRGERWFERFRDQSGRGDAGGRDWSFEATAEPESLVARRGSARLFLVAGRQIVVREGLEVLALATGCALRDGLPLADTLDWARERGAIAVLPWGFGKWWRGRGAAVRAALGRLGGDGLFLGDSAGRPALAPRPGLFRLAESRRIHVLPGSDPLPLPAQQARAGSYGFVLEGSFDERRPAASLRRLLAARRAQPASFGRRAGLLEFALCQAAMQARKRGLLQEVR